MKMSESKKVMFEKDVRKGFKNKELQKKYSKLSIYQVEKLAAGIRKRMKNENKVQSGGEACERPKDEKGGIVKNMKQKVITKIFEIPNGLVKITRIFCTNVK